LEIKSSANSKLKQFRLLQKKKYRERLALVPLEGVLLVEDALAWGIRIEWAVFAAELLTDKGTRLLSALEEAGVPVYETSPELLQEASGVETSQGIICAAAMPSYSLEDVFKSSARLLILDRVQDPGNMGTLFRTALAGGVTGIICAKETVDPWNPKVLRASMGAVLKAPFLKDLEDEEVCALLEKFELPLYCCHPRGKASCFDIEFSNAHALVISNESRGLSPHFLKNCHQLVRVPLEGPVESLNAAVAGAIVIYEALRQNLQRKG
jgi:RNA methyltransferase, TrmH family